MQRSKNRATYSINHFWKQDLSASNFLPNFADDLNVHKSPSVSKSWIFDVIADNFSSLDNNFLMLNTSEQPFISKSYNDDFISISTSANKSILESFIVSSSKIKFCLESSIGGQGKSASFSDIASKCVLSAVPVTNTLRNINCNKKMIFFFIMFRHHK